MTIRFFVDHQFGFPYYLTVTDGLVTEFLTTGGGLMKEKLQEKYGGKPIAFFKEDFESHMKPCWYCVKPEGLVDLLIERVAIESRIRFFKDRLNSPGQNDELLRLSINREYDSRQDCNARLEKEYEMLKEVHQFDWKKYSPNFEYESKTVL